MSTELNHDSIVIEISAAELVDKITVLQIKSERIKDPLKLKNVNFELDLLTTTYREKLPSSPRLDELFKELKAVNESIWDSEDEVRVLERAQDFGPEFLKQTRNSHSMNERRFSLKKEINELVKSKLIEEKSYVK